MSDTQHLSLTPGHTIAIVKDDGSVKAVPISEALGERKIYDLYGNERKVLVTKAKEKEHLVTTACSSGEMMTFGSSHTFLVRKQREGRWKRVPILSITEPVLVQLPQRKVTVSKDLFSLFDIDENGIYLEPARASEMLNLMQKAAFSGIAVSRRKTSIRIDLERNRPSCFGSKLINGSFDYDLEATLSNLIGSGIVTPVKPFDDSYLEEVRKKKILMEGASVFNNVPMVPPKKLEKLADVYHITLDDDSTPIELQWCHS